MKNIIGLTHWYGPIGKVESFLEHNFRIFDNIILITDQIEGSEYSCNLHLSKEQILNILKFNDETRDYIQNESPGVFSDIPFYFGKYILSQLNVCDYKDTIVVYFDLKTYFWNKFFLSEILNYEHGFYVVNSKSMYAKNNYGKYISGNFCIDATEYNALFYRFKDRIEKLVHKHKDEHKYTLLGPYALNKFIKDEPSVKLSNFLVDDIDYNILHYGINTYNRAPNSIGVGISNVLLERAGFDYVTSNVSENGSVKLVLNYTTKKYDNERYKPMKSKD